jgi:hypothetical protein
MKLSFVVETGRRITRIITKFLRVVMMWTGQKAGNSSATTSVILSRWRQRISFLEASVIFYHIAWCYISEDSIGQRKYVFVTVA